MRLLPARLFLCLAVLLGATVRAGNLDAPAVQPVTVRSEIDRGYSAALKAAADTTDPDTLFENIQKLMDANEQARTETDAFKLGVCFGEWRSYWTTLNLGAAKDGLQKDQVASYAYIAHHGFRSWAEKLGLTDAQLKEVFGSKYDATQDEPAFENALKTKRFKGSMPKRQ